MPSTQTTQVAVVGAGPAGLVLAHLLNRAGIRTLVLERHARATLGITPKAGVIEYRTAQLLTREGLGEPMVSFETPRTCCEFRTTEESVVIDFAERTGGYPNYSYPQHQLVDVLATALIDAGGSILFEHTVDQVQDASHGIRLSVRSPNDESFTVAADVVVGCDGANSNVARRVMSTPTARVSERQYPARWLVISAGLEQRPTEHNLYAAHPRGFAAHVPRPGQTRFYLEIPNTETLESWPHYRLVPELRERLGIPELPADAEFHTALPLDLQTRVRTPMQAGRVFVAGDAAHLITPAGAKGMNLAIQDAVELAHGIIECFGPKGDESRLKAYSATRLPIVWRTQAFSDWLLHIISSTIGDDGATSSPEPNDFARGIRDGWVANLKNNPLLAHWFAHAYAGVDP